MNVDNSFSRIFDKNMPLKYKECHGELEIPFAVNENNEIDYLRMRYGFSDHALLTGAMGCGKSTLLNSIIAGILLNYHPDDVELWLVDFKKVEFSDYLVNTPPHIKLIGLANSDEFVFRLIDELEKIIEFRKHLFCINHARFINDYNELPNVKKLPQIFLILDNVDYLFRVVQKDYEYKDKLEEVIFLSRRFGVSCIFSCLSIELLRGFRERFFSQFPVRLAMRNSVSDVEKTLDSDYDLKEMIKKFKVGEVIRRHFDEPPYFGKSLSLMISREEKQELFSFLHNNLKNYDKKDLIIVNGNR